RGCPEERGGRSSGIRAHGRRTFGVELHLPVSLVAPEVAGEEVTQLREPEGEGVALAVGRDLEQPLQRAALDQELDGGRLDRPEHLPFPVPDEDLRARHLGGSYRSRGPHRSAPGGFSTARAPAV